MNNKRFAVIELHNDCNRKCIYCGVIKEYRKREDFSFDKLLLSVDWLYAQGYRLVTLVGGEPLAPFRSEEGKTHFQETLELVNYATGKGMVVNVTTNGDYLTKEKVERFKKAGLDFLSFSLHTYTRKGLDQLINKARLTAQAHIVPTIHAVLTKNNIGKIPKVAFEVIKNGILFSICIVQEKGSKFSASQSEISLIPSVKDQLELCSLLLRLKALGFVRNNREYLTKAPEYYPNRWICNAEEDAFIYIGTGGEIHICSEVRTNFNIADIRETDNNDRWRNVKRLKIRECGGCLYNCLFEAENQYSPQNFLSATIAFFIRCGFSRLMEIWGNAAVKILLWFNTNIILNNDL
jgi:MoaA/NifB/PqqE/SkfB family radical SAM enzyme